MLGGWSRWSIPPHPPVSRRAGRGSPVCGVLGTHSREAGFPDFASPGLSREQLFLLDLGAQLPTPPQVHLGPSRRKESGNACPWQPFQETFPSHAGPCSAGKSFVIGRLKASRTWPGSADLGTFRGETPGAFWVPARGEKKHLCLGQGESPSSLASSR